MKTEDKIKVAQKDKEGDDRDLKILKRLSVDMGI
jgi:hypothetical protein